MMGPGAYCICLEIHQLQYTCRVMWASPYTSSLQHKNKTILTESNLILNQSLLPPIAQHVHLEMRKFSQYLITHGVKAGTMVLHSLTDTRLTAHAVGGPWWSEEHPGEGRDVRGELLRSDQVLCRLNPIGRLVCSFARAFRNWRVGEKH